MSKKSPLTMKVIIELAINSGGKAGSSVDFSRASNWEVMSPKHVNPIRFPVVIQYVHVDNEICMFIVCE